MKMNTFGINWGQHRWAIFFCAVSSLGALCYGYDQIYYTGVLGMKRFVLDYGTTHDKDGNIALTTTFISLTASIIYVGELFGALIAAREYPSYPKDCPTVEGIDAFVSVNNGPG